MFHLFLSDLMFSTLSSDWFPILLFWFLILGFLFVSFRPSRFHSHSCFTGASLFPLSCVRFFIGLFCEFSTFFRLFLSASDYSAFCLSFPFFSNSSVSDSFDACFLIRPTCFHVFLQILVLSTLRFLSPITVSLHSSYFSISTFSFRILVDSP